MARLDAAARRAIPSSDFAVVSFCRAAVSVAIASLTCRMAAACTLTIRPAACSRLRCHLEKATNVKSQRLPAIAAWHRCSISDWIFGAY